MSGKKSITGRINIDTDDEGLLAVFRFTPEAGGAEWDLQSINRYISERKIVYGFDRKTLEGALNDLLSKGTEAEFTLAEGDAPVKPVPAEWNWTESKIPEERKADTQRVLHNAAPPEILRTEIEKVRQERVVKKKGILPFGKEKEETVAEIVKLEKRVRVAVESEVVDAGWVEAGTVIAEIYPGKPGALGKDVYGRPIPSPSSDDEFWPGRNIETKGGKYIAAESGVLRRGVNWVEVLQFKAHDWSLELSKDKNTCLLRFNPGGLESNLPDPAEIIKRAEMLGCAPDTLFSEDKLTGIIRTAVSTGKILDKVIISTDDDGFFEIRVTEDKLKAELVMHKGRGEGKSLVLKQVGAAIKSSGLKGLDLKKIQEIILEFYRGPETDLCFTLCEGIAAEHGETGKITWDLVFLGGSQIDDIKKRSATLSDEYLSKIESAANYPPAEAAALALVKDQQQIAVLPVDSGKSGVDVYGKEVESSSVDTGAFEALENVKFEGGNLVSTAAGLFERFEKEGETAFRIRPYQDSETKIKVSADRMSATMTAVPSLGAGRPPSLEDANRLIAEAGLAKGINTETVRGVVEKARAGESVSGALIAMGQAPKNAGEYKLKFLIELAGGEAVSIDASGKADYRKQNKISSVKEGDLLAEIQVIEGESKDGWDVLGKALPAKQLTPLNVEIGNNIREEKDEQGDTFLVAAKSGRVLYENNRIEVQESLFVKGDVDFGTGNIKFGGDVNVKGNVRSGFYVMAGGNVAVGMNSEMSLLSSDKSIMVAQGVKGGGKAIIRAKASILLSFAERATLLAVEDITVKNAVFNCKVKCNGKLRLKTEKGYLVGGRIQARGGIEAANIGSGSGSRTQVSFGQDYLISDQIEIEENEINKIKNKLIKIDPEMRNAERSGETKILAGLRMEKFKLMKILEKRSLRVFTLKERFEQHHPGEVIVRGEVFPGVVFESHGRYLEISKKEKAVKILFNQETGMLETVSLEKKGESGGE
ncbi:MAG: DUF342 domain-containing protein [Spirochaetales bacterium]|nr:DUF342 domain-containing protein [Spirochaetales bacterium]